MGRAEAAAPGAPLPGVRRILVLGRRALCLTRVTPGAVLAAVREVLEATTTAGSGR